MGEIIKAGIGAVFDILDILIGILPSAPFRAFLNEIGSVDVLGYVNYFIPFSFCAKCMNAWLACVLAYYVYRYLKRAIQNFRSSK